MSIVRKVGMFMSCLYGFLFGAIFSTLGMLMGDGIVVPGIIISAFLSSAMSVVIALIIPIKICIDKVAGWFKVDSENHPFIFAVITALVGDLIMTPIICFVFMAKQFGFGDVSLLMKRYAFNLLIDFFIAWAIGLIAYIPYTKLASKIFKVPVR